MFVPTKGTKIQEEIASVFTDIAQVISLSMGETSTETYEADTLDNADAGIPRRPTGRTNGAPVSGELFLDPALAGHKRFTAKMASPLTLLPQNYKLVFADTGATEWPFVGAGVSLGATVALNDGLKAAFSIEQSKIPTFPA